MFRLFFRGENRINAAQALFGREEGFDPARYEIYEEIELCVQPDGRYSVWGNLPNDADLLRDTRPDRDGLIARLRPFADEEAKD